MTDRAKDASPFVITPIYDRVQPIAPQPKSLQRPISNQGNMFILICFSNPACSLLCQKQTKNVKLEELKCMEEPSNNKSTP